MDDLSGVELDDTAERACISALTIDGGSSIEIRGCDVSQFSPELLACIERAKNWRDPDESARAKVDPPFLYLRTPFWTRGMPSVEEWTKYPCEAKMKRSNTGMVVTLHIKELAYIVIDEKHGRVEIQFAAAPLWSNGGGHIGFKRVVGWLTCALGEHIGRMFAESSEDSMCWRASNVGWRSKSIELALDSVGLAFEAGDTASFTSKSKTGDYGDEYTGGFDDEENPVRSWGSNKRETIYVGSRTSRASLCIYAKTNQVLEVKGGSCHMYGAHWRTGGNGCGDAWSGTDEITRVELRLTGDGLVLQRKSGGEVIDLRRLENATNPELLAKVWAIHTSKMRLIVPVPGQRVTRAETDERWAFVQQAGSSGLDYKGSDFRQRRAVQKATLINMVTRTRDKSLGGLCGLVAICGRLPAIVMDSRADVPDYKATAIVFDNAVRQGLEIALQSTSQQRKVYRLQQAHAYHNELQHFLGPEFNALSATTREFEPADLLNVSNFVEYPSKEFHERHDKLWAAHPTKHGVPGERGRD